MNLSILHQSNHGHRASITPMPRRVSTAEQYAAIRLLETTGVLSARAAEGARRRVL